ncbi:MAG: hypothetical protein ACP5N7_03715 [Candidatus Pacearchaeota archaeon]
MKSNLLFHYMTIQSNELQGATASGGIDRTKWITYPSWIDIPCHIQNVNREQYATDLDIPNLEKLNVIFYIADKTMPAFGLQHRIVCKKDYREKIITIPTCSDEELQEDYIVFMIKGVRAPVKMRRNKRFNFNELYVLDQNRWTI